jgi:hypothetical protein
MIMSMSRSSSKAVIHFLCSDLAPPTSKSWYVVVVVVVVVVDVVVVVPPPWRRPLITNLDSHDPVVRVWAQRTSSREGR